MLVIENKENYLSDLYYYNENAKYYIDLIEYKLYEELVNEWAINESDNCYYESTEKNINKHIII